MEQVIYLDVLLVLNLFVNYFLFLGTARFFHSKPKRLRLIAGAAVGSLFSFLILVDIPFWLTVAIKLPLAALLVLIVFGFSSRTVYIKTVLSFFAVNFIFGGVMFAVWMLFSPAGMYVNNGVVYFNISAFTLVIGTLAAYLVIRAAGCLFDNRVRKNEIRRFVIGVDGKELILSGFLDTGNKLADQMSGSPVVICELSGVESLIPPDILCCFRSGGMDNLSHLEARSWSSRIRVLPYSTIGKGGLLPAFRPDYFCLLTKDGRREKEKQVLVGVTDSVLSHGEYQAVLSSACI